MEADALVTRVREQRLTTLALADQVGEERWREPAFTGTRSLHDLLAELLGWTEWAVTVFEVSAVRPLPTPLTQALSEGPGFDERARRRYRGLSRADLLAGLQASIAGLVASARSSRSQPWEARTLAGLRSAPAATADLTVGEVLALLVEREAACDHEVGAVFGLTADLDRFRPAPSEA